MKTFLTMGWVALLLALTPGGAPAQTNTTLTTLLAQGASVLPPGPLDASRVGGLERTNATAVLTAANTPGMTQKLVVRIGKTSTETNATQMTLNITAPVKRGDALIGTFLVRGQKANKKSPAEVMFLFERSADPWTKSASQQVSTIQDGKTWRRISVPFTAAEDYQPGEAMVSLRFAFGPQTVEIADLRVLNFGRSRSVEDIQDMAARLSPLGKVTVGINRRDVRQTMLGFGGNYCQPRYGSTEKIDRTGQYTLDHLKVTHARIGVPLNYWTPEPGVYRDDAQARAAFLLMQEMQRRKIPMIATIWEGPVWMLGGRQEQMGRVLSPDKYAACIDAIVAFLKTARDKYGVTVDYFSFNEADYGVNFKFSSEEIAAFMKQAAPEFAAAGLKTRWLTADTANGANLVAYATPLLADKELAPLLGPIAFHNWDALGVSDATYQAIAALARKYNKPVWCTEGGHDAQLWQQPNPWSSWENALRLAVAYNRTLDLTGASLIHYWTYQNNYPLVDNQTGVPHPAFYIIREFEEVFPANARVVGTNVERDGLYVVASLHPGGGFGVLLANQNGAGSVQLTGLPPKKQVTVYQSDRTGARKPVGKFTVTPSGMLTVPVPARSVVSLRGR